MKFKWYERVYWCMRKVTAPIWLRHQCYKCKAYLDGRGTPWSWQTVSHGLCKPCAKALEKEWGLDPEEE